MGIMLKSLFNRLAGTAELSYVNIGAEDFITSYHSHKNARILDVRTPEELSQDRISDDQDHIDMFDLSFMQQLGKLNKATTYFVYCRSGNRSKTVAKAMVDLGFSEIYHLSGGIASFRSIVGNRII
jgi:rhodanese-related sulfurtransferase